MNNRENPYKEWGMWGGIFTALSVAATIAFSAFGIAFGWPLAIAILGALFTAVVVAATYSHEKTSERNEVLTERRKHEKQQEIEKQIQKDKIIAQQMQMKKEEAQMEEAMNVVRNEGWIIDNTAEQDVQARDYISQLLNKHNIVQETNNFTVSSLRNKIAQTNIDKSFTVGFAKNGKIATIDIDGTKIYNKGR